MKVKGALLFGCLLYAVCSKAQDTAIQLKDVVVTGQYQQQSVRQSVYRIRTISSERIQLRGATDVLGVLNSELGIRFSNDAALGETDVELMGMSGQSVKILLDGVPLVDRGSTRQSLSQMDINTIDRIEIVEGPMSVVYGTDALAGVINLITKKGKGDQLAVTARVQEETVGTEYKPFNGKGLHNESLALHWSHQGWFANGSFTRNDFGGWQGQYTGRKKEWHPKDQWLGGAMLGYSHNNWEAWYRLDYLDEDISSLGDINTGNYRATDQHYLTDRYTHQAQAAWQLNERLSFNGALSWQVYKRRTQTTIKDFQDNTETLSADAGAQDVSKFNTLFFRTTAQYKVSPKIMMQPGIEVRRDASSGQRIEGEPVISDYAVFVSAEIKPVTWMNIRPGIRFSKNSVYDAPPAIPSINTRFSLNKHMDLRLSYGRGFRAPALRELYFYFFDASHAIQGNPDLKAEYSHSVNGSLNWQVPGRGALRYTVALSGFYNHFDNLIDIGYDASDPAISTYININKFRTTGGMLEHTLHWKALQASLGFSYIGRYNRFTDDTTYNKTYPTPAFTWTPEVNANITWHFKRMGASLSAFYKYSGARPTYELADIDNATVVRLAETAAFHYADVTATQRINKFLSVNGGVKNLFNVDRLRNTSRDVGQAHSTGGPVLMWYGRSYFLGLSFRWTKS
ncbi:TonB-dependent receptor plug domain-containing protein [Chitinophaga japonensis]|uniref:Outer membrane receptor for ferrienterochelin and colicins n=1 Tax=Chitinophaga japonensis TaxID=104662 RepID=A0A562TC19_CHIJA|nr:TonB-dependent receptor [Chitinophaga japonensis]TWI91052.1 outer membrane receptor for ferrienterochelin and colicins [Chitinophaga japonensis]